MTISPKGTALVTDASSGIVKRDPARNRPLPQIGASGFGSDRMLIADPHRFLFIVKNPSLLRSYSPTPFVM